MEDKLVNANITGDSPLPSPRDIRALLPVPQASLHAVLAGRRAIRDILSGKDRRLLIVVGPCSIHDHAAALEYAHRLKGLAQRVSDRLLLAMRVYFEKPRTTTGWKGLINDPYMDDSFRIQDGLKIARKLLLDITSLGLATASEALDPVTPQYLSELICWYSIGARTIESQTHRELASGLSTPVGFKNGTDGNIEVAVNAMRSARASHNFLGMDNDGRVAVFRTRGNPHGHLVLRGGRSPNYDAGSIARCEEALGLAGLPKRIMVDCSHGNSNKDHNRQPPVFDDCLRQIEAGNSSLMGMMVESNLRAGNQPIPPSLGALSQLQYGVSVTDKCIDWEATEKIILDASRRMEGRTALCAQLT